MSAVIEVEHLHKSYRDTAHPGNIAAAVRCDP